MDSGPGGENGSDKESDDPRDMTLFKSFLRPVGGENKAWSNSLRAAQESGRPHKHVLPLLRKLITELPPEISGPNFRPADYIDAQGKKRPMIEFCQDVLTNVFAAVGGPRFHILLCDCSGAADQSEEPFDIVNVSDAVAKLDPYERDDIVLTDIVGRRTKTLIISEPRDGKIGPGREG
jgi:hypothetical protein